MFIIFMISLYPLVTTIKSLSTLSLRLSFSILSVSSEPLNERSEVAYPNQYCSVDVILLLEIVGG